VRLRRYDSAAWTNTWLAVAFMVAVIALLLIGLWARQDHSDVTLHADHTASAANSLCLGGCPIGTSAQDTIIMHHILVLANDPRTKFADWVAYRITRDTIGTHCQRRWERDPDISEDDTLEPSDYFGIRAALNADRGHQAPLASLCGSPYWQEADYLSNITPQKSTLNEGTWEHLERAERDLVYSGFAAAVYSVTGPLYEREIGTLPRAHLSHVIPSGYWKIIAVQESDGVHAAAFLMDQNLSKNTYYCTTLVSVQEVERRTHLTFFRDLPEKSRKAIVTGHGTSGLDHPLGC
jgi:endonuclease G, mitochondrial